MSSVKWKPKKLLKPITTDKNSAINRSQLVAITCYQYQAWPKVFYALCDCFHGITSAGYKLGNCDYPLKRFVSFILNTICNYDTIISRYVSPWHCRTFLSAEPPACWPAWWPTRLRIRSTEPTRDYSLLGFQFLNLQRSFGQTKTRWGSPWHYGYKRTTQYETRRPWIPEGFSRVFPPPRDWPIIIGPNSSFLSSILNVVCT